MVTLLLTLAALPALAQATQAVASSPKSGNVRTGSITLLDSVSGQLSLRGPTGTETAFRLTEHTLILKARKTVERSAFAVGESVVVRFRRASNGVATLYDLVDKPSWDWLARVRRTVTEVSLRSVSEDRLACSEGSEAVPIEYRVTPKTLWGAGGKAVGAPVGKAGDRVFVAPRLLPSGGIMAVAVADTKSLCQMLLERSRPTCKGVVAAVNAAERRLTVKSGLGDIRELRWSEKVVVRRGGHDVTTQSLHTGAHVVVHLKSGTSGEREVSRITIDPGK